MLRWYQVIKKAPTSRPGYTLIELAVVLVIIGILAVIGLPSAFTRNDRYVLDNSANQIKELITDARVRSAAPTDTGSNSTTQVYQVTFSSFNGPFNTNSATGDINTNLAVLQRGQAQCDKQDVATGLTDMRTLKLPRRVYISSFYPTNQSSAADSTAAIRFDVGKVGFFCGKSTDPSIDSTDLTGANWEGKRISDGTVTTAKYLVLEVSMQGYGEKRYVAVDRLTSEVFVSKTNPQPYLTPIQDTYVPQWINSSPTITLKSVSCSNQATTAGMTINFPRAKDFYGSGATDFDLSRNVYYEIDWSIDGGTTYKTLAAKYFSPLTQQTVQYTFSTTPNTINSIGMKISFKVIAYDDYGNKQAGPPDTSISTYLEQTFTNGTDWICTQ